MDKKSIFQLGCQPILKSFSDFLPVWGNPDLILYHILRIIKFRVDVHFKHSAQSTPESILDYGTNYCNLFNLMDGSGLAQQTLTEETNDAICTQRSIADCDKF